MRRSSVPARLMLLLVSIGFAVFRTHVKQPSWRPYTSEAGGFSVSLPGTPVEKVKPIPGNGIRLDGHLTEVSRGDRAYMVMYIDYPHKLSGENAANRFLNATVDGFAERHHLFNRTAITIGPVPGIEIHFLTKHNYTLWEKMCLVDRRFYQIIAVSPRNSVDEPDAVKFMNSFRLTSAPTSSGSVVSQMLIQW